MGDDVGPDGGYVSRARATDDFDRPGAARVYDFLLGGASHGQVDRELARDLLAVEPRVVGMARENRAFMRRAVDFLVGCGIEQFIDLGSGIPTIGSVHEIARRRSPGARVVYVDLDPVAAAHTEHLLASVEGVACVRADLQDPDAVITSEAVQKLIDLDRPVGLLLFSALQHVPDRRDPAGIVRRYLEHLPGGSALAVSHLSDGDPRVDMHRLAATAVAYSPEGVTPRGRSAVAAMLAGVDLVPPGLGWAAQWRPEPSPGDGLPICGHLAGVGFLPVRSS